MNTIAQHRITLDASQTIHVGTNATVLGVSPDPGTGQLVLVVLDEAAPMRTQDINVYVVHGSSTVPSEATDYIGTVAATQGLLHIFTD